MDMCGAILKKRIKEMGYTQEKFAEVTGVRYGTLKKYLSGKSVYPIDLLQIFAEKLDCSYDYLMGYTVSPKREYQDLKDATRLSDKAIDRLKVFGRAYEKEEMGSMSADTVSKMLEMENLVETVAVYFFANDVAIEGMRNFIQAIAQATSPEEAIEEPPISMDNFLMMCVMERFAKCKSELGE